MRTIWKYELVTGFTSVDIPKEGKILRIGEQQGEIRMWVEVCAENPMVNRKFQIVGTGLRVPHNGQYIGGVSIPPYEWFVYELFT